MRWCYILCGLGYQVTPLLPSLRLWSVGYRNKMVAFVLDNVTGIKHFSFVPPCDPVANYIQGCRKTLDWLLAWRLSAPLSPLFCLCDSDRLHQTERSQSRELPSVSLIYITPRLYHITGQSEKTSQNRSKALSYIKALTSGPALHELKEAQGHGGKAGREYGRTGHSNNVGRGENPYNTAT